MAKSGNYFKLGLLILTFSAQNLMASSAFDAINSFFHLMTFLVFLISALVIIGSIIAFAVVGIDAILDLIYRKPRKMIKKHKKKKKKELKKRLKKEAKILDMAKNEKAKTPRPEKS